MAKLEDKGNEYKNIEIAMESRLLDPLVRI